MPRNFEGRQYTNYVNTNKNFTISVEKNLIQIK